jgi:hypothetical protein
VRFVVADQKIREHFDFTGNHAAPPGSKGNPGARRISKGFVASSWHSQAPVPDFCSYFRQPLVMANWRTDIFRPSEIP